MFSHFKKEFHFFTKRSLEVVGLTRLKCKQGEYSYGGKSDIEFLEVVSQENDFEGILVRLSKTAEEDIKPEADLGTFYVIKNRRGDIRFVEIGIEDDPICTVVKRARICYFLYIVLPRILLGTAFAHMALVVYFSQKILDRQHSFYIKWHDLSILKTEN
ncbi:hypothetical protein [Fusibacter ferrireducens]|uniref:Uncharacterized protein n=1 Tax=Fusibacter ferrireducens TaxID=2785058 RepID=A0ABR9ZSB5_9FIRM|nr:hypothetical protein [Fusibacter ferrireducens]MBF4693335.1 hypothetical protein [Fusibacter ferrireducens]